MNAIMQHQQDISKKGYIIIDDVFNAVEIQQILDLINDADTSNTTFRKSANLFAIRQFLKEIPAVKPIILKSSLTEIIESIFGKGYFPVKSIFFDKPEQSNW